MKRIGLLAVAAAALGACDFGLVIDPEPPIAASATTDPDGFFRLL